MYLFHMYLVCPKFSLVTQNRILLANSLEIESLSGYCASGEGKEPSAEVTNLQPICW